MCFLDQFGQLYFKLELTEASTYSFKSGLDCLNKYLLKTLIKYLLNFHINIC